MSEHVTGTHRSQTVLFPDTIEKYVEKENQVRNAVDKGFVMQDTLQSKLLVITQSEMGSEPV